MGPGTIEQVLAAVAAQVNTAIGALVPVGQAVTGSFAVLSILLLGAAIASGNSAFLSPILRATAAATGTFWAVTYWPDITRGTLDAARAATGLLLGGYSGPSTLFQMANDVAGRVLSEKVAVSLWSPSTYADGFVAGISGVLIWLGLSITGLLAVLAEFQLLIGAAAAPLVLPALAFGLTSSIGWGPVTFMVSAGVRVVVMGAVSFVMGRAVTTVIAVPGTDAALTHEQIVTLLGVSLLTALVGLCCNSLARDLVTGSPGSLGWGSVVRTAGTVAAVASAPVAAGRAGAAMLGGASRGAAAGLGAGGASASGTGGAGGASGGLGAVTRSSGTGSPFG